MLDIKQTRKKLNTLRAELTQRIDAINTDVHHKTEPVEKDFAEQVTQRENDEVLSALDVEAQQTIISIDAALKRIENGSYEICTLCGEKIAEERLVALPFATTCIRCAEKQT